MNWETQLESALNSLLQAPTPANLSASIRYSLLSPGKRFRPRLMEASAHLLSVPEDRYAPFAVALEMIHAFTLIHDDLPCMDDDDVRRGLPTNHKVYGEALALLAGDALIPAAVQWTTKSLEGSCPHGAWAKALQELLAASGPQGVIGGQAHEFLLTPESTLSQLQQMHSLKTGALFQAALLIPAHLAGLVPAGQEFKLIHDFSRAFGLAFQIADDLEDAEQEWDEAAGGYPYTSVLAHLPFSEAQALAMKPLKEAAIALASRWPGTSAPLSAIADELARKLAAKQETQA